jgi:hypothetical protein
LINCTLNLRISRISRVAAVTTYSNLLPAPYYQRTPTAQTGMKDNLLPSGTTHIWANQYATTTRVTAYLPDLNFHRPDFASPSE